MSTKRKLKLKKPFMVVIRVITIILVIFLILFSIYSYFMNQLHTLGYSKEASWNILIKFKKDYIVGIGNNKTLNAAFSSKYYKEKNLKHYSNISYVKQANLIKNINSLIKIGYSDSDISMIVTHGSDSDVSAFTKRKKVIYLEEYYTFKFAKLANYDRYVAYADATGDGDENTVVLVNLDRDKEDYKEAPVTKKFDFYVLVDKHHQLDKSFKATDLATIPDKYTATKDTKASKTIINAYINMYNAASKDGYGLIINSAYRSYQDQQELVDTYVKLYGQDYVNKYVALAGYSEHQTGLSLDIGSTTSKTFVSSKEYNWMVDNSYKYGFIQRFPKKYEAITGFNNEAWHFRYVGLKIAKYIYLHDMSYDEYYARFLDKSN